MKRVNAKQHQDELRYGRSAGIQCSCMSLVSILWNLIKNVTQLDTFDLHKSMVKLCLRK